MLAAKVVWVALAATGTVLLVRGLNNMTYFKYTPEAQADEAVGRTQLYVATSLFFASIGMALYVHSASAAMLALVVGVTSFGIAYTRPKWLTVLSLFALVPMMVAALFCVVFASVEAHAS